MDKGANPVIVALLCVARCMIPLMIMLGVTYLLKRLGLIAEPTPPPPDYEDTTEENHSTGGLAHGSTD